MQGKLFQRCTYFLYCSVLSFRGKVNVNTWRMSQPDMESIFTKIIWNSLVKWNYSCLQSLPRENWFQYERRIYATAINFPCISTLVVTISTACPLNWGVFIIVLLCLFLTDKYKYNWFFLFIYYLLIVTPDTSI